ncbi:MAG: TIGR04282 family arsenosugar biosynthesis glycosyltransferase [Lutispora sp.]|nr:TIGR04282 family arsenosugar biosynthesis glycosyltransferase [Lutispora sp.]MDD4834924.1 TIGR04282 family arsenosugar biosynthesis glycosyltransferase [Lutispora sp.]
MKRALIIMTRVPIPGKTKTRLEGYFSKEQCAMLHIAFLKDIYKKCKNTNADVFVFYTPIKHENTLKNIIGNEKRLYPQEGIDLGERMSNAINKCISMGYDHCILIGSDIPAISVSIIEEAFAMLEEKDIAIAPTYDGGYCLIGMKKPYPQIFRDNFYGTDTVYEKTVTNIKHMKLSIGELDKCLDIDVKEDVELLARDIKAGKHCDCINTKDFLHRVKLLYKQESTQDYYGANDN